MRRYCPLRLLAPEQGEAASCRCSQVSALYDVLLQQLTAGAEYVVQGLAYHTVRRVDGLSMSTATFELMLAGFGLGHDERTSSMLRWRPTYLRKQHTTSACLSWPFGQYWCCCTLRRHAET